MNIRTIKQAFYKSIPVCAGYVVLGIGFGILMRNAGYWVIWAASMSIFIYAGSMQYIGIGLLTFRKKTPKYVSYLGKTLPPAIIGMLVIYCLKDITPLAHPFGIPELIAGVSVVGMQAWKRNSVLSILLGTIVYMILIRFI